MNKLYTHHLIRDPLTQFNTQMANIIIKESSSPSLLSTNLNTPFNAESDNINVNACSITRSFPVIEFASAWIKSEWEL